jgi:hypothetical protein
MTKREVLYLRHFSSDHRHLGVPETRRRIPFQRCVALADETTISTISQFQVPPDASGYQPYHFSPASPGLLYDLKRRGFLISTTYKQSLSARKQANNVTAKIRKNPKKYGKTAL